MVRHACFMYAVLCLVLNLRLVTTSFSSLATKLTYHLLHLDEVGITKPLTGGSDIYPSCVGYKKTMRKQVKLQKQKIGGDVESNDGGATTICSNKTIDGWRVLRFYKRVGQGKDCYARVQNAVFNWDFEAHYVGIVSAKTQKEGDLDISLNNKEDNTADCTAPRRSLLATFTEICLPKPLKSFFVVNPVHVVYEVKDERHPKFVYSSTAYATMSGHLLSGEERVTVVWRNRDGGEVDVEIVSFSRSAPSLVGKIIWPLIGRMQTRFFLSELDHLDNVAKDKRIKQ